MNFLQVLQAIFEDFELDVPVTEDTRLIEDGIIDSLRIVYILSEINDRLGVDIPIDKVTLENFGTLHDIAALIAEVHADAALRA